MEPSSVKRQVTEGQIAVLEEMRETLTHNDGINSIGDGAIFDKIAALRKELA